MNNFLESFTIIIVFLAVFLVPLGIGVFIFVGKRKKRKEHDEEIRKLPTEEQQKYHEKRNWEIMCFVTMVVPFSILIALKYDFYLSMLISLSIGAFSMIIASLFQNKNKK